MGVPPSWWGGCHDNLRLSLRMLLTVGGAGALGGTVRIQRRDLNTYGVVKCAGNGHVLIEGQSHCLSGLGGAGSQFEYTF